MATRISANGQHYTKSFGLSDACSYVFWGKVSVDRTAKSGMLALASATTNFMVGTDAGTGIKYEQTVGASVSTGPGSGWTVGTWYRFGLIHTAASTPIAYFGAATGALTATTLTSFVWAATTSIKIGCEPTTTNFLNGCIANFKAWDATLTVAELTAEFLVAQPQRLANLSHYHPFIGADLVDYSGQNRNLGGGSGAASEVGPPIPIVRRTKSMLLVPAGPPIGKLRYKQQAVHRSYSY